MKSPKPPAPPAPPDPIKTGGAQTATNIGTAIANTVAGNVNQYGPYGSTTYKRGSDYRYRDPVTGKIHKIPTWSAVTKLSPAEQRILNQSNAAELNLARTANRQSKFLEGYLSKPANFDTQAIEDHLYDMANPRLQQRFEDQEDSMRTRLANQGIAAGSDAWEREFRGFDESRNDAYNQLMLQGRAQAFSEMQARRNQPINEITALLSGSQVSNPNTAINTPAQIPTTDYAGLTMANYGQQMQGYNAQMNSYNQKAANRSSIMGGLFGLGAAGITGGLGLL